MSLVLVEAANGAQVLPDTGDRHRKTTEWAAHCSLGADLRTKSGAHRQLAARLLVKDLPNA